MKESIYQETQRKKLVRLLSEGNKVFYGGKGGKYFMRSERDFVLTDYGKNFFQPIRNEVIDYFAKNGISWWGGKNPTGHVLSSQIACLNHLFAIRKDKQAVLSLLRTVSDDFVDVDEIYEHNPAFIQFEAVSDKDHLNEEQSTRGSNCTSIDALIFAKHKDGSKWLIPIEWKYTEHYQNQNKANEGAKKDPINCKGEIRKKRYTELINQSNQLQSEPDNNYIYYFEPFYQLMRQTLWAEQMIKHKETEKLKADKFLHIHIIPKGNDELLKKEVEKKYKCSGLDMENTWRKNLKDNTKYLIISPENLLQFIDKDRYAELLQYLSNRYWTE